jgi:cysteinyl-tRNA synthetase
MKPMLELYNTMSRRKEVFKPLTDKQVKMFTCGPSIYRRPHVGNYRSFLWEDVLQRYLEYLGYTVQRVLNFTDVEDKAIAEATQEGIDIARLTGHMADQFLKDAKLLGIELPPVIPRSSTSVDQAVKLITNLLSKGFAYWYEKDVFFDPLKFDGFGRLYRLDMSRWPKEKKRFKRDTYPGRRWNLGDFILWHGYRAGDPVSWDTDIGKGRPSWNIQDPAMITEHLGYRIDIACGGIDNLYRHHDYNIAVVEAASGAELARYWLHGEHLLADGKKMSKSKGNIVYPEDLIEKGCKPRHLRFYLIYGHHRERMNLTRKDLCLSCDKLESFEALVGELLEPGANDLQPEPSDRIVWNLTDRLLAGFEESMNNDLDVKGAFDSVFKTVSSLISMKREGRVGAGAVGRIGENLRKVDQVLQVVFP